MRIFAFCTYSLIFMKLSCPKQKISIRNALIHQETKPKKPKGREGHQLKRKHFYWKRFMFSPLMENRIPQLLAKPVSLDWKFMQREMNKSTSIDFIKMTFSPVRKCRFYCADEYMTCESNFLRAADGRTYIVCNTNTLLWPMSFLNMLLVSAKWLRLPKYCSPLYFSYIIEKIRETLNTSLDITFPVYQILPPERKCLGCYAQKDK